MACAYRVQYALLMLGKQCVSLGTRSFYVKAGLHSQPWASAILRWWVAAWMLLVPLFHAHPAVAHQHGEAGHVHGGTLHSVFSSDLDDEYPHHQHTTDAVKDTARGHSGMSGEPLHRITYAEAGFSFLSDSSQRSLSKPLLTHICIGELPAFNSAFTKCPNADQLEFIFPLSMLTQDVPSRAPPF
jgi:hypothetical protein